MLAEVSFKASSCVAETQSHTDESILAMPCTACDRLEMENAYYAVQIFHALPNIIKLIVTDCVWKDVNITIEILISIPADIS